MDHYHARFDVCTAVKFLGLLGKDGGNKILRNVGFPTATLPGVTTQKTATLITVFFVSEWVGFYVFCSVAP